MYRKGSTDIAMIKQIQQALGLPIDGVFGNKTEKAVINFQMNENLVADGIVGPKTLELLEILDTDLKTKISFTTKDGLIVNIAHLPKGEYIVPDPIIKNDYIVLHHTAGWDNPYNTIQQWGNDARGKIATEFVIGGQNIKSGDNRYDGQVVQAFPEGCQGWHIGYSGSKFMNRHSVGVELCNFGQLNNNLKNYIGVKAHESQICTLSDTFKGYNNFHKYSDKQLYVLKKLLYHISNRDNIDLRKGLISWIHGQSSTKAFSFQQDAFEGKVKGLLIHGNIRKDKIDVFPQPELIDMLLSL